MFVYACCCTPGYAVVQGGWRRREGCWRREGAFIPFLPMNCPPVDNPQCQPPLSPTTYSPPCDDEEEEEEADPRCSALAVSRGSLLIPFPVWFSSAAFSCSVLE